jgi:hypothetical protein
VEIRQKSKIGVHSRPSFARCPRNDALSFQGSQMIHRSGLTMESEVGLNFTTGRREARSTLLSTNEIEDFLLTCSELGHGCSTEHCTNSAKFATKILPQMIVASSVS